jgi:hypothetical protein
VALKEGNRDVALKNLEMIQVLLEKILDKDQTIARLGGEALDPAEIKAAQGD